LLLDKALDFVVGDSRVGLDEVRDEGGEVVVGFEARGSGEGGQAKDRSGNDEEGEAAHSVKKAVVEWDAALALNTVSVYVVQFARLSAIDAKNVGRQMVFSRASQKLSSHRFY